MRLAISTTETLTDLTTDLVVANNNNNVLYEFISDPPFHIVLPYSLLVTSNTYLYRKICDLADEYHSLVFIDECHATGFFGKTGR